MIEFLRPSKKKVYLFLLILCLYFLEGSCYLSILQLKNAFYCNGLILAFLVAPVFIVALIPSLALVLVFLLEIAYLYSLSCLIIFLWNKLKAKKKNV